MTVVTSDLEVGIRELKANLSRYVEQVRGGAELVVTDRGRPVARLVPVDGSTDHLAGLIAAGLVRAPRRGRRPLPKRIKAAGPVSDLVAQQRR